MDLFGADLTDNYFYGSTNRPGGFELTKLGIDICDFPQTARIADIGCGYGATVRYLAKYHRLNVTGIDYEPEYADSGAGWEIVTADASKLPFENLTFDGFIFECSLSKMNDPDTALGECYRALKFGGKLLVTDLYARGEAAYLRGMLRRLERIVSVRRRAKKHGYKLLHIEDHSEVINQMWAELLINNGADALYNDIGADAAVLRKIRCGYYLAVWEK